MAVTTQLDKIAVKMNLNNGRDSAGNVKTVALNLGSLNPTNYDAAKAMTVTEALSGCLSKSLYSVQEVRTSTLIDE